MSCLEKVLNKEITLNDLKKMATDFRKLEMLKGLFVKLTCTANWEDAKVKYPLFAMEERLSTFY